MLGFVKKTEFPAGEHRWLTVVSPEAPDGPELALEPDDHPRPPSSSTRWSTTASRSRHSASTTSQTEHKRLTALGVRFTQEPLTMGPMTTAVLDDTCGNLIQIASQA